MKLSFYCIFLASTILLSAVSGKAQITITGQVLSGNKPIPFTNIGILNSVVGTISDEDGTFGIKIPPGHLRDSIIFSSIGYEKKLVPVSALAPGMQLTVHLRESTFELTEVVIRANNIKPETRSEGNKKFEGGSIYADTVTAGSAMALLVRNNQFNGEEVFIKDAKVMITNNKFPQFKVRLRLMEVTPAGLPGRDLLEEDVIVRSSIENGYLKTDLRQYRKLIKGDFFLVYEWILDSKDRRMLFEQYNSFISNHPDQVSVDYGFVGGKSIPYVNFKGNFYAGTSFGVAVSPRVLKDEVCYYRLNSFGTWFRSAGILTAQVTLTNRLRTSPINEQLEPLTDRKALEQISYYSTSRNDPSGGSERATWSGRAIEPLALEVRREENRLSFHTENRTPFPYRLSMQFSRIFNLEPHVDTLKFVVPPGRKSLLFLNVVDTKVNNYHYELSTSELIGDPARIPSADFPYLIPIGNHRAIKTIAAHDSFPFAGDQFQSALSRDTVYAMRQGNVTALPIMTQTVDRISTASVEVLHADGTIMVYDNLDPAATVAPLNSRVSAGQPIGLMRTGQPIAVQLFKINSDGMLTRLNILYLIYGSRTAHYDQIPDGYRVSYPDSIIALEKK